MQLSTVRTVMRAFVVVLAIGFGNLSTPSFGQVQPVSANFTGNFTTIKAPSGQMFVLARQPDCSLTYITATYTPGNSSITYTQTGYTLNYEKALHTQAGLTTTPDVFTGGCADPTTGIGTRPAVYVGKTTAGINVYASINYNAIYGTNALNILTNNALTFNLTSYSFNDAYTLSTADLNGDGNGDLVVTEPYPGPAGKIYVLLGKADGTFQTAVSYPTSGTRSIASVIDDFNGDGKVDIVTTSDDKKISVLPGNGDGTFQAAQTFTPPTIPGADLTNIISADLNSDGKKDLAVSNGLILLGKGDGTFTTVPSTAFPVLSGATKYGPNLAAADLNKDGKLDIVLSTGSRVFTYAGKGDGTFSPSGGYATVDTDGFVTVTDLDGDGNTDIYIGDANAGYFRGDFSDQNLAYALMGNGNGTFSGAPALSAGYNGTNLGDVNNDGKPDLIVANSGMGAAATFTVYLGTSTGAFAPASTISFPTSITVNGTTYPTANAQLGTFAVADVNGDKKADLVFATVGIYDSANTSFPFYFVALSNGDGTFQTPVAYTFNTIAPSGSFDTSPTIVAMHLADIDHDGKTDMQVTYTDTYQTLNSGTYVTHNLQGFLLLPGNNDGTFGTQTVVTTYNDTVAPPFFIPPQVAQIADLNGDSKLDLIAVARTGTPSTGFGSQVQIFLNTGGLNFAATSVPSTAPNTPIPSSNFSTQSPVVLADLNGDNKLDLIALGETKYTDTPPATAQMGISLGNGDGTFGTAKIYNLSGGDLIISAGVASTDINGDGKLDVIVTSGSINSNGIFFGNGDGTINSITSNAFSIPTDVVNLYAFGPTIPGDFNADGKTDLLVGSTLLLNRYGSTPPPPTPAATTTSLTSSVTSVLVGGSVTLTATVASSAGTPGGSIVFFDGSTSVGTASLDSSGKATQTAAPLTAGTHSFTAAYQGNTSFAASTSGAVTVTAANPVSTTTALATSATTAVSGTLVTFTATVAAGSGTAIPGGTVTFKDGTTTLGTGTLDASGKANYSTSALSVASHSITASYAGATGFTASTSATVTVIISAPVAADFTVMLSPTSASIAHGTTTTTTLTLTPIGGFKAATTLTCAGAPSNSTCTVAPSSVTPDGSTPITATVTIKTDTSATGALRPLPARSNMIEYASLGLAGVVALIGIATSRRRRLPALFLFLLTSLAAVQLTACGGSSKSSTSTTTPSGSYTLGVTGTSGSTTHSSTFTLTVQ